MNLKNIYLKIVIILSFLLLSLANLFVLASPSIGYELSVYKSTPVYFWLCLIFVIFTAVSIILYDVYSSNFKSARYWIYGLIMLLMARLTLLWMPFNRGYYSLYGDQLTHIGLVKDILTSGYVYENYYPITHILISILISIMNLDYVSASNYSTAIFSIFYILSLYLLCSVIFHNKLISILVVGISGGVFVDPINFFISPNGWSAFLLSFLFYLYFKKISSKKNVIEYGVLFVTVFIMYSFFHPISMLLIILMLVSIVIFNVMFLFLNSEKISFNNFSHYIPITDIFLGIVLFSTWVLSFRRFDANIRNIYSAINYGNKIPTLVSMSTTLNHAGFTGFDILWLAFKMYGDTFILLCLSLFAFYFYLKYSYWKKYYLFGIIFTFILTFGLLYLVYLFDLLPGLMYIDSERSLTYLPLFAPIPASFLFSILFYKKKKSIFLICVLLIIILSLVSIIGLYYSPYVSLPNSQVTEKEITGAKWCLAYQNMNYGDVSIFHSTNRFFDLILGFKKSKNYNLSVTMSVPDHFNYSSNYFLGSQYSENKYFLIGEVDFILYDTVWKNINRFSSQDFYKLNKDLSVSLLYSNGGSEVYFIKSMNSSAVNPKWVRKTF